MTARRKTTPMKKKNTGTTPMKSKPAQQPNKAPDHVEACLERIRPGQNANLTLQQKLDLYASYTQQDRTTPKKSK
ncbi:MAG: hypothetical protein AAF750_15525 [Planctomycetota bacterium]